MADILCTHYMDIVYDRWLHPCFHVSFQLYVRSNAVYWADVRNLYNEIGDIRVGQI